MEQSLLWVSFAVAPGATLALILAPYKDDNFTPRCFVITWATGLAICSAIASGLLYTPIIAALLVIVGVAIAAKRTSTYVYCGVGCAAISLASTIPTATIGGPTVGPLVWLIPAAVGIFLVLHQPKILVYGGALAGVVLLAGSWMGVL